MAAKTRKECAQIIKDTLQARGAWPKNGTNTILCTTENRHLAAIIEAGVTVAAMKEHNFGSFTEDSTGVLTPRRIQEAIDPPAQDRESRSL